MNEVIEYTDEHDQVDSAPANPFGQLKPAHAGGALAEAGQQREIAEVQAAMIIAKRFPRDPIAAMDRILQACTRPTLAEGALYSYSRGGSDITGPSIRLAEVAAQAWGNVQFGIRELEQRPGKSTVEAFAWDVETNTRQVKVFQVEHMRHTSRGAYKLTDARDIYELVANNGARRLRACILGVIPGDVIEAAVKQCERTMRASADTSPEGLKKLAAGFEPFGVTQAHIEKRCQCRLEAIRPAQVVMLRKVWASLRDGMSSPSDWFDMPATERATATGADGLGEAAATLAKAKQAKASEPEPEKRTPRTAAFVRAALHAADTAEALEAAAAMIADVADETEAANLRDLAEVRGDEMGE